MGEWPHRVHLQNLSISIFPKLAFSFFRLSFQNILKALENFLTIQLNSWIRHTTKCSSLPWIYFHDIGLASLLVCLLGLPEE